MPKTVGRYEILEQIGQGGMGAVYKAFDPVLRRTVAVKLISAVLDSNPDMRERFFREARAAGQLSHKNIIVIHDLGEERGQPFLAMEYLTGAGLDTRMSGGARLSAARAVEVMIEVCQGLDYAHERGIVHRDIKPGNLFVTDTAAVKILDFGLAHLVSSELTHSETIMGTANYMAPEQVKGERVDRRADLFAVGVVLYELLAGHKAFEGDSFANTLYKVLETVPEPLHKYDPTLPLPLLAVVDRAISKRKDDRYQTAAEMLSDLLMCRDWLRPSSRAATVATTATTVVSGGESAAAAAIAAATPRSVAWSPRRVRTTAIVGGMLAVLAAISLLRPSSRHEPDAVAPAASTPVTPAESRAVPADPPRSEPVVQAPPPVTAAPTPTPAPTATVTVTPPTADERATRQAERTLIADRARADLALTQLKQARALADASGADSLAAPQYREAVSAEGEAKGLYAGAQFAKAASRATDAAGLYRNSEAEARAQKAAIERQRVQPAPEVPRDAPPEPQKSEPVAPPPTPPPAAQMAPAPPDQRDAVQAVVNQYVGALEARSITALKAIWPSLGASQERAIRSEFENARSLQVRLTDSVIDVMGDAATVTAMRHYQLVTTDGHRLATTTRITMRLRRIAAGWVIDNVTYQ